MWDFTMLSGGTKICRLKPLQTASFSGAPLFVQMINLRDGMNQIFIFFPRLIQGLSWRMQQLVGQLDGQPFQNLFRRCAFGKLFHRIFQHLLARFLALVPQGVISGTLCLPCCCLTNSATFSDTSVSAAAAVASALPPCRFGRC